MKSKIILTGIILLALFLRFQNINWDSGFHLHPDERFLTMVGNAIKIPNSVEQYFNPDTSPLNPPNVGFSFFVYGAFPIILNKIIALLFGNDTYGAFTLQGRILSGLADMMVLFLVFKTAELLFVETGHAPSLYKNKTRNNLPLLAAFFYAIAVLPIQLSHFFTTDSFLNLFMFASFYFALRFNFNPSGLILRSSATKCIVIPLKKGIQSIITFLNGIFSLDSRLRGNDKQDTPCSASGEYPIFYPRCFSVWRLHQKSAQYIFFPSYYFFCVFPLIKEKNLVHC